MSSLLGTPLARAAETPPVGHTVDAFALRDAEGQLWDSSGWHDVPVMVLVFLGTECPLARRYAMRLEQLATEFAPSSVVVLGIDSNAQDTAQEMQHFARELKLSFPILQDPGAKLADACGATRTPQAFVLDRDRVIRYAGRIDDQFAFASGVGFQRPAPTRQDLAEAVRELLAGRPVSVPATAVAGCLIGRVPVADEQGPVHWATHIEPLFRRRCQSCHRPGEVAPFSLLTYEDAVGWQQMIAEVVRDGRMPPWGADPSIGEFANASRLTAEEATWVQTWVAHGAPRGASAAVPSVPESFTHGWQIGEPHQVFYMAERPFHVPATGKVEYQYFEVQSGFNTGRWVRSIECRAGAPAVVHHINVFLVTPEMRQPYTREDLTNKLLWGTAPGLQSIEYPGGFAAYVPPHSKFVFQMHYTANGVAQADRSYMGLKFADDKDVQYRVDTRLAVNSQFVIPAGAADVAVESFYELPADGLLLALSPHMHLRGKAFRYEAQEPSGEPRALLNVPRFDFNWQHMYVLASPRSLPKGTMVQCYARFDNSSANPANPDPSQEVRWGDQITDEMMIGYLQIGFPKATPPTDRPPQIIVQAQQAEVHRRRLFVFVGALALTAFFGAALWRWRAARTAKQASRSQA